MLDLADHLDVGIAELAAILFVRSVGSVAGAGGSGFIFDRFRNASLWILCIDIMLSAVCELMYTYCSLLLYLIHVHCTVHVHVIPTSIIIFGYCQFFFNCYSPLMNMYGTCSLLSAAIVWSPLFAVLSGIPKKILYSVTKKNYLCSFIANKAFKVKELLF